MPPLDLLEEDKIIDSPLNSIRQEIKKTMIPLLIKIFELKHASLQAKMPPSRLQQVSLESPEKIREDLRTLEKDLNLLDLWCQSCQKQIAKALKEIEELPSAKTSLTRVSQEYSSKFTQPIFATTPDSLEKIEKTFSNSHTEAPENKLHVETIISSSQKNRPDALASAHYLSKTEKPLQEKGKKKLLNYLLRQLSKISCHTHF